MTVPASASSGSSRARGATPPRPGARAPPPAGAARVSSAARRASYFGDPALASDSPWGFLGLKVISPSYTGQATLWGSFSAMGTDPFAYSIWHVGPCGQQAGVREGDRPRQEVWPLGVAPEREGWHCARRKKSRWRPCSARARCAASSRQTAAEERRMYPDAGKSFVGGSREDETAPVRPGAPAAKYSILPEILGESAGPAIYLAFQDARAATLGITSLQGLKDWFAGMIDRDLDQVEVDEERVLCQAQPRTMGYERIPGPARPCATWSAGIIFRPAACSRSFIRHPRVLTKEDHSAGAPRRHRVPVRGAYRRQAGRTTCNNTSTGFHPVEQRRPCFTDISGSPDQADHGRCDNLPLVSTQAQGARDSSTRSPGLLNFRAPARARGLRSWRAPERHSRNVAFVIARLTGSARSTSRRGARPGTRCCGTGPPRSRRSCAAATWCAATGPTCSSVGHAGDGSTPGGGTRPWRAVIGAMRSWPVETDESAQSLTRAVGRRRELPAGRPHTAEEWWAKAATPVLHGPGRGPGRVGVFYSGPPRS